MKYKDMSDEERAFVRDAAALAFMAGYCTDREGTIEDSDAYIDHIRDEFLKWWMDILASVPR